MMLKKLLKKINKIFKPPKLVSDNVKQYYHNKLAAEWREIVMIDTIIILFLVASAYQIAYVFANGEPGLQAWIKALGFDLAIAIFSRHVSRAKVDNENAVIIWLMLSALMVVTVFVNILYEWLIETGAIGLEYIVTDPIKNIKNILTSGSLAIIILGISAVRANLLKSFEKHQREFRKKIEDEKKRAANNERQRRYQQKLRAQQMMRQKKMR